MKKVLVIVESINVDDSSGSKANVGFIKSLSAAGYEVKVLHYTRKDIQLEGVECISIKENKFNLFYVLSRTQRVIQRNLKVDLSVFLENLFGNSFTFFNDANSIASAIKQYSQNDDLIITLSKAASFRPHYAMLKRKELHSKWLAYVHDPYPFGNYPEPYSFKEKGFKFKSNFFRKVSEKAQFSGFPSQLLKEWMGGFYPNFLQTGVVIPHQTLSDFNNDDPIELPSYFNSDAFTLVHAGSLLEERNPKYLVEAFQQFLDKVDTAKEDAQLVFIGSAGVHKDFLLESENNTIVWSKGYLPYCTVRKIQNLATVNVILEANADMSPFLPGKFPHLVESNKPILHLGPEQSECVRLLGNEYPYKSDVTNIENITEILISLYDQWKVKKEMKLNRKDLEAYFEIEYFHQQIKTLEK